MQISSHRPHFSGIYQFKTAPEKEKAFTHSVQTSSGDRVRLCARMVEKDRVAHSPADAIVPYKGKILGFSGKEALELMKACSDIFVTTLYQMSKRNSETVFHSPARPFDEDQVTRFLESKGKTLENIEVIHV